MELTHPPVGRVRRRAYTAQINQQPAHFANPLITCITTLAMLTAQLSLPCPRFTMNR